MRLTFPGVPEGMVLAMVTLEAVPPVPPELPLLAMMALILRSRHEINASMIAVDRVERMSDT